MFLISQPRAGSTLLQRILGSHPDIHTVSEPWLMLQPLYALRPDGYRAEYNEHLARNATQLSPSASRRRRRISPERTSAMRLLTLT